MTSKNKRKLTRQCLQIFCFLMLPSLYTSAFSGIRYVITQLRNGEPLAANGFLLTLLALCGFTIVFGRFFCGYICAFGTLGDGIYALVQSIRRRFGYKKEPRWFSAGISQRLQLIKYFLLPALAVIYYLDQTEFFSGSSPWDVFSMLYAGKLPGRDYLPGIIIFILILIGMAMKERFFCQYLCPMGAVFALLPHLPVFQLQRNQDHCPDKCSGCQKNCPVDLKLRPNSSANGECIQCMECLDNCPRQNIHIGSEEIHGNEILVMFLKAVLLFVICLYTQQLTL